MAYAWASKLGRRLLTLHVKDLDEAMHDVPWGTGKGDIAGLFRALQQHGIRPALCGIEYETKWEHNTAEIAQCGKFFEEQVKRHSAPASKAASPASEQKRKE